MTRLSAVTYACRRAIRDSNKFGSIFF